MIKKYLCVLVFLAMLVTARGVNLYTYGSDHCPNRDTSCLTNFIAGIGTNFTTVVLDGGPWMISNTVVIPPSVEILYSRDSVITTVGTNQFIVQTIVNRDLWSSNMYIGHDLYASNDVFVTRNMSVGGTITVKRIIGDGSGLSNLVLTGTIDYQIDGTTNIVPQTITASSMATGAVGSVQILDGSITASDMGTNSVVAYSNIVNGSILNPQMGTNSVTTQNIVDGTISSNDIAANTIGIDKITTNYAGLQRMVGFVTTSGSAAGVGAGGARVMMISTTQVPRARTYHLYCYVSTSNSTAANFYNELAITAQVSSNGTVWLDADKGETVQGAVNGNGISKAGKLSWDVAPGMYFQVFCNAGTTLALHQGWTNSFQYGYPSTE